MFGMRHRRPSNPLAQSFQFKLCNILGNPHFRPKEPHKNFTSRRSQPKYSTMSSQSGTAGRRTGPSQVKNDNTPQNPNVDADEQLAPFGEGEVARAVAEKHGAQKAPGDGDVKFDDYSSQLDR